MSTKRCYYETLEVERNADESKLKAAFRKLAMKWHPDKNPGDVTSEIRFKEINEAYEVLKDGEKRAAYDRFGHAAFEHGGGGGPGFGAGFASSFSDIFEDLFGMAGQRGRGGRERGADLRYNMEITLEEAFLGKTAQIEIPVSVTCESCSGTGAKAGTKPRTCSMCAGAGRVRQAQGFFTLERTCPGCQGRGQMIEDPCPSCSGSGRVTRDRTLSVNIPQGVEDGTRIRLAGEGEAGVRGGPPGDLYIFLSLASHEFFQRDGADLHCRQGQGEDTLGNPVQPALSHCIKRHAGASLAADRRHVRPGRGRNAPEFDQEATGIAGRVRKIVLRRNPA
jgi:molecular chaperone DnaJ